VASKGGKTSGKSSSAKAAKSSTAKSEKTTTAKSEKASTAKSGKSSVAAALDPQDDMDDTAKLLVGLLLDLFTKPDQAVGDIGIRDDTLGGALMMLLDLFKDYADDGGRRGLRADAVATASKEDMEKLKAELIKVLNELRE